MSGIGKNSTGYSKVDYPESKIPAVGFKRTRFAHQATAGDVGINFGSLITPQSMLNRGFVQPSHSTLIGLNIGVYKNNLDLSSSARGPLEADFDYEITSSNQINFLGFSALQDEVFIGKIDPVCFTGTLTADGTAQPTTGTLAVGVSQFNVGFPFQINQYPGQQLGAIQVFRNGKIQARNLGNSPSGNGNYWEQPVSGGFGYLINFNVPGSLQADGSLESIMIVVNGFLLERPQASTLATIENLQGQMDVLAPTVASLAGVPLSNFQVTPNHPDLASFGQLVLSMQATLLARTPMGVKYNGSSVSLAQGGSGALVCPNAEYDTTGGGYNPTTGIFTVPENAAGIWLIGGGFSGLALQATVSQSFSLIANRNSANISNLGYFEMTGQGPNGIYPLLIGTSVPILAQPGDQLAVEIVNGFGVTMTTNGGPEGNYVWFHKIG